MERVGLIYVATHKQSGRQYVGQTILKLEQRKYCHIYAAKKKASIDFHKALLELGADSFEWSVLEAEVPRKQLTEKEESWIQKLNTINTGFNRDRRGNRQAWPKERIKRRSDTVKGSIRSPEARKNMSEAAKKRGMSEEHKKRMTEGRRNSSYVATEEHKRKLSESTTRIWAERKLKREKEGQ